MHVHVQHIHVQNIGHNLNGERAGAKKKAVLCPPPLSLLSLAFSLTRTGEGTHGGKLVFNML